MQFLMNSQGVRFTQGCRNPSRSRHRLLRSSRSTENLLSMCPDQLLGATIHRCMEFCHISNTRNWSAIHLVQMWFLPVTLLLLLHLPRRCHTFFFLQMSAPREKPLGTFWHDSQKTPHHILLDGLQMICRLICLWKINSCHVLNNFCCGKLMVLLLNAFLPKMLCVYRDVSYTCTENGFQISGAILANTSYASLVLNFATSFSYCDWTILKSV